MSLDEALGEVFPDCDHPVTDIDSRGRPTCARCGADLRGESP